MTSSWSLILQVSYSIHTHVLCVKYRKTVLLTSSTWYSGLYASCAVGVSTTIKKQQFIVTHRHTARRGTEGTWPILNRPTLKHVMFPWKHKDKHMCCGHNIWTEGVFVTQLSNNVGISVWRTVWVMENRRFVSVTSSCQTQVHLLSLRFSSKLEFSTKFRENSQHQISWKSDQWFCSCYVLTGGQSRRNVLIPQGQNI